MIQYKEAAPLKLKDRTINPKNGIFLMGILNVTPDSFFAESRATELDKALEKALAMVEDGADIIDIGAESTRPGSLYVSEDEEINRLIPFLKLFRKHSDCPVSIDTRKFNVFKTAFEEGADILNDISALEDSPELAPFCAENKLPVILMHKREKPDVMMQKVCYNDAVSEISAYLKERADFAIKSGIAREKIILDPGIGFAKDFETNCKIIKHTSDFSLDGRYPVLIGASRKQCVGQLTGKPTEERLAGTLAIHQLAVLHGAQYIRAHDVKETADMLKTLKGIECDII
ncbi:MAG: dihydropteroate synthase [Spirochaetaceae bacterium]|nr:dihydropteroate synthase [Spirochaetaceae bacterium]